MESNVTTAANFLSPQTASTLFAKSTSDRASSFTDHLEQQTSRPTEPNTQRAQPEKRSEDRSAADSSQESDAASAEKARKKPARKPVARHDDDADAPSETSDSAASQTDPASQSAAAGDVSSDPAAIEKPAKAATAGAKDDAAHDPGLAGALGAAVTAGTTAPTPGRANSASPRPGVNGVEPRIAGVAEAGVFHPSDATAGTDASDPAAADASDAANPDGGAAATPAVGKAAGKHAVALLADEPSPVAPGATNKSAAAPPAVATDVPPAPSSADPATAVPPVDAAPAKTSDGSTDDASAAALAAKPALAALAALAPAQHAAAATTPAAPSPEAQFAETNHANIVSGVRTQLLPHGGTMQIRLDPPELGALQVLVEMRNGSMSATFQTSNDDATRLLSHSLGQLKTALEAQGVTVDKIQVQQSPRDQHAPGGDDRQQQGSLQDQQQARQDQQRKEMLQRMWRKLSIGSDPIDLVA